MNAPKIIAICWVTFVEQPTKIILPAQLTPELSGEELLNWVFRQFNRCDGHELISTLKLQLPSLSMGDMVCEDGRWWTCAMLGWQEATPEEIEIASGAKMATPSN